ncbi:MAG: response regulator [Elusimicrobia bacterium]|nr:response regulator [Elusimicrobiota bacterium]
MTNKPARRKILIIDDEQDLLEALSELLEKAGYRAICAANGADGVRLNEQENPDIIVLDLRMPGMDGIETLRRIREHDREVSVVILTANGSTDTIRDAVGLAVSDYLSKPFENGEFIDLIGDLLWRRMVVRK